MSPTKDKYIVDNFKNLYNRENEILEDLDKLNLKVNQIDSLVRLNIKETRKIRDEHGARFDTLDTRLDEYGTKFDALDTRLDEYGTKFDTLDTRLDEHGAKFDALDARLDEHGAKLEEHGSKLDRILEILEKK